MPEYDALLSECFRLLKPGGILLVHETLGELASQWEGFDPEDLTPGLAYVSMASVNADHSGCDCGAGLAPREV